MDEMWEILNSNILKAGSYKLQVTNCCLRKPTIQADQLQACAKVVLAWTEMYRGSFTSVSIKAQFLPSTDMLLQVAKQVPEMPNCC